MRLRNGKLMGSSQETIESIEEDHNSADETTKGQHGSTPSEYVHMIQPRQRGIYHSLDHPLMYPIIFVVALPNWMQLTHTSAPDMVIF